MNMEDKGGVLHGYNNLVEPNAGERRPLSSNKAITRSPALDFANSFYERTEAEQLHYLAEILFEFLKYKENNANGKT